MSMLMKNSIYINGRGRIIPSTINSYLQQKIKINPMTVNNTVLSGIHLNLPAVLTTGFSVYSGMLWVGLGCQDFYPIAN